MEFFTDLHNPAVDNVLGSDTENSRFEDYYRDHLRKLLLVRQAGRYASKGNYNLTRLSYLLKLFPDARFVLPVRSPRDQIASLHKQHELLRAAAHAYPRSLHYLDRVGHFEFGVHRTPINAGDSSTIEQILSLWENGDDVRGWARYWAHLYGSVADQLTSDDRLRQASMLVHYEDMCGTPHEMLEQLFAHCQLKQAQDIIEHYAPKLHRPDYYRPTFTPEEEQMIDEETAPVVARLAQLGGAAATPVGSTCCHE